MKKTLLFLLLSCCFTIVASAQQGRVLTPAEQRQKEKIDREIQRERQIRAQWLQDQRDYEAKKAEKERQRQAKKAAKDNPVPAQKTAPAPTVTPTTTSTPANDAPATAAPASAPVSAPAEPTRKEKREKRKKEKAAEPAPATTTPVTTEAPATVAPTTTSVEAPKPAEPAKPKQERKAPKVKAKPDSVAIAANSTGEPSGVQPRKEFLPKGHLFEPIMLDPLEAQTYGSVLPAYWTEGKKYAGSIVPFEFGFAKPFYRRTTEEGKAEEWVLDLASFTQFEAYYDAKADKARRTIMNNDYKVSIIYNVRRGDNNYRFRVYHLSSHLGDDYIFRNQITAPTPNSVNYELLDVTYSRNVNNWRLYGGAGIVLRKSEERKPISAQLGTFYKKPSLKATRLVGGVDIKFWQQTDFRPGIHGGIGFELGRTQNNLTFLLEGYSGFRPYSQFENQQTSWIGFGLYMNPF